MKGEKVTVFYIECKQHLRSIFIWWFEFVIQKRITFGEEMTFILYWTFHIAGEMRGFVRCVCDFYLLVYFWEQETTTRVKKNKNLWNSICSSCKIKWLNIFVYISVQDRDVQEVYFYLPLWQSICPLAFQGLMRYLQTLPTNKHPHTDSNTNIVALCLFWPNRECDVCDFRPDRSVWEEKGVHSVVTS